ncbi:MAG: hypothetical protein R6V04_16410 [bacterium]
MKCRHIKKYLPLYSGDDLNPVMFWLIRQHLKKCPSCRIDLKELQQTQQITTEAIRSHNIQINNHGIWNEIVYRLSHNTIIKTKSKNKNISFWHKLVPGLIGLVILVIIVFVTEQSGIKKPAVDQAMHNGDPVPVVEDVTDPHVTVMTFKTNDPKITIVWFFKDNPQS